MRRWMGRGLAALVGVLVAVGSQGPAQARSGGPTESGPDHDQVVAFWTAERVAAAVPRDFERDPVSGRFHPARQAATPTAGRTGGGSSSAETGADWTRGGVVSTSTGKVLFQMGASYYVCSAGVVADLDAGRSLIVTAAHCAYDETARQWATNWVFIPDYDSAPAPLTVDGGFCANTRFGCWTASALVVDSGYADAGGFTAAATRHDVAVAVVGGGGLSGSSQLDVTVGAQAISFGAARAKADTYAFGYPHASPYDGTRLVYSRGSLAFDPLNAKQTYRIGSTMTGGASGGPWFAPFQASSGRGTQISVTSYGYSGMPYLHGPIFGSSTAAVLDAARTAEGNTVVPVG